MPLNRAVAYCQIDDSLEAGKTAAQDVLTQLNRKPDFLLLFATVGHDMEKLLQRIQTAAADIPLVGCSGAVVISNIGCDEANLCRNCPHSASPSFAQLHWHFCWN